MGVHHRGMPKGTSFFSFSPALNVIGRSHSLDTYSYFSYQGSINHRINVLYFLDSLCESSLLAKAHQPPPSESSSYVLSLYTFVVRLLTSRTRHAKQANTSLYVDYVSRDLRQIVECVVPAGRQGLLNLTSTKQVCTPLSLSVSPSAHTPSQILENWRTKRIIEPQRVDDVMHVLATRKAQAAEASASASAAGPSAHPPPSRGPPGASNDAHLSRGEIFKRIEEDRERHKRLRERRWVQAQPQIAPHGHAQHDPVVPFPAAGSTAAHSAYALASFLPLSEGENAELALDIEFENEWEATSDWNEDDVEAVMEERELCFPHLRQRDAQGTGEEEVGVEEVLADGEGGEEPMDLS